MVHYAIDTNGPHNVRLFSDHSWTKTLFVYRRPMPRVTTGRTQFNQLEGTFSRGHIRQFSSFAKHFSERVSVGVCAPAPCRPFHVTHNQEPVTEAMGGPLRENRFLQGV